MANIGNLLVRIGADTRKFHHGMRSARQDLSKTQRRMKTFKKAAMGIGVAIAAAVPAITAIVNKTATWVDGLAKSAKRLDVNVTWLSKMEYAAKRSGTTISAVENAISRMSKATVDAQAGMTTYIRAFDRLGVSLSDLRRLTPEELFFKIAQGLSEMSDSVERIATARDLMGRGGTQLLPMFNEGGAEQLRSLLADAERFNAAIDKESAKAAEKYKDAILNLSSAFKGFVANSGIIGTIANDIEKLGKVMVIWNKGNWWDKFQSIDWIKDDKAVDAILGRVEWKEAAKEIEESTGVVIKSLSDVAKAGAKMELDKRAAGAADAFEIIGDSMRAAAREDGGVDLLAKKLGLLREEWEYFIDTRKKADLMEGGIAAGLTIDTEKWAAGERGLRDYMKALDDWKRKSEQYGTAVANVFWDVWAAIDAGKSKVEALAEAFRRLAQDVAYAFLRTTFTTGFERLFSPDAGAGKMGAALGSNAVGGSNNTPQVNIYNQSGMPLAATATSSGNNVEIVVKGIVQNMHASGELGNTMKAVYGVSRQGVRR